jgi:hypothetical protein
MEIRTIARSEDEVRGVPVMVCIGDTGERCGGVVNVCGLVRHGG